MPPFPPTYIFPNKQTIARIAGAERKAGRLDGRKEDLECFAKIYVSGWGIDILLSASRSLPAPSALWLERFLRRLRVV